MKQGLIQRTVRQRVEPRAEARLPAAWISTAADPPVWTDGAWLTRTPDRAAPAAQSPVLAWLGNASDDARAALLAQARAGARVYALVGPEWGKSPSDQQVHQAPRVLIRRLPEVPATALHTGDGAQLWIGGGFVLRLSPAQADALRHCFLRLFWHEATEEASSGDPPQAWRSPRERPFDVPQVPASASVRWEPADARLSEEVRGGLVHVSDGLPPGQAAQRLWFRAGPDHHQRLAQHAQAGVQVLWADRGLPNLQVKGGTGEALLPGTRGRLRVHLTSAQAAEVARLMEAPAAWRFQTNVRLGEANHQGAKFWLAGEAAARGLEAEQRLDLPDVPAVSLRQMPETEPPSLPAAQPLALAVCYRWTVVPPRVPTSADEDPLVGRWQKLDEDWAARLARVREVLVAAERERGRIGRAFARLASAVLGFGLTHGGLLARLEELEALPLSAAGPAGAPELLTRLGALEDASRKLEADLEEAERKAQEEEQREKQQAAWKSRVDNANRDLPDRRAALVTAERRRARIEDDLRAIEEDQKTAEKEVKKDLLANQRKLSDELQRANKEVTRLRSEIAALEQQAAEPFEFRPPTPPPGRPAQPGGRFVPTAASARPTPNLPDEALPEVGSLRVHKGQRYLVISRWEELDAGERTASRLNAKLVAPENA